MFRRVKELREENAEFITQKRSEAEDAIRLMTRSAETKMSAERSKNGLIILQADYGLASAFTDRGIRHPDEDENGGPMVIDVTIPLQSMVQDSRVMIPGGRTKSDLLGFYDPCIGESKKIRIRYLFSEKVHEVTVTDKETLRIPMKGGSTTDQGTEFR
jgi:DnaJ family protein C protein 11